MNAIQTQTQMKTNTINPTVDTAHLSKSNFVAFLQEIEAPKGIINTVQKNFTDEMAANYMENHYKGHIDANIVPSIRKFYLVH